MIKNPLHRPLLLAVLVGLASACQPAPAHPGAFQGVIELEERVLGFEAGGRLLAVHVQRGATVQPGDPLAALDDSLARTAREAREAEANAAEARLALLRAGARSEDVGAMSAEIAAARATESLLEKEATRTRSLVEAGALAQAALDQAEAALTSQKARRKALEERLRGLRNGPRKQEIDTADAQTKAAEKAVTLESERLARHTLRAQTAGTVLDVHADPGEIVAAGTPVVTVADTAHPYVDVFVPQGNLDGIRTGSPATVFVDATPDPFPGRVEDVGRRTEFTPRYLFSERERPALVVRVRVRVDDPTGRLHAGVPAFVSIDRSAAPIMPSAPTTSPQPASSHSPHSSTAPSDTPAAVAASASGVPR